MIIATSRLACLRHRVARFLLLCGALNAPMAGISIPMRDVLSGVDALTPSCLWWKTCARDGLGPLQDYLRTTVAEG